MDGVLSALDRKQADVGIFPVVNSRGGLVQTSFEAMGKHLFKYTDELWLEVYQCLMAKPGVTKKQIKKIATHPQAISQCERYIRSDLQPKTFSKRHPGQPSKPHHFHHRHQMKTAQNEIENLRKIINELDDILIETVARRMIVSRTVGVIKKQNKLKIKDPKREKELKAFHQKLAKKQGITYKTLQKIFELIMEESKRVQKSPAKAKYSLNRNKIVKIKS